jgi:hypothetical protein
MNFDWIPVKDRLPEINPKGCSDLVLVTDGRSTSVGRLWAGKVLPAPYPASDPRWAVLCHVDETRTILLFDGMVVDRWLPLPGPPSAPAGGLAGTSHDGSRDLSHVGSRPTPQRMVERTFEIELVMAIAETRVDHPDVAAWIASWLHALCLADETGSDPWIVREVTVRRP